jgi:SecD/SecF fusion protein
MRNKGFFWFLTILLTAVCVYQLSFTWVATNVEKDAEKEAVIRAEDLRKQAMETKDTAVVLPNQTTFDYREGESFELAKAAFLNQVLTERAQKKVYPVMGSTFQEVKKRSLAFGLDLVGGMSVTLEISVPKFIESQARNARDLDFKIPFDKALNTYNSRGGDFIDLFREEYEKRRTPRWCRT